jgi:uncharacterized membrane protein YhaH (DUF805 family)
MNTAVNPYQPPRAEVSDVHRGGTGFQEVKVWSSKGRIGRLRYLAYLMGGYILFAMTMGVVTGLSAAIGGPAMVATLGSVLIIVAVIPYLVLSVLTAIQRCHDIGWSGWMALLSLVPLANLVVGLMWLFKAGGANANAYGQPPVPNTRGVKILAWIAPVVFLIGILAAVALPQYKQYQQRQMGISDTSPPVVAPPVGQGDENPR